MGKGLNKVSFSAYCRAFESLDENSARVICSKLDPSEGVYSVADLERGKYGDGTVTVREYMVEAGRLKVSGSRFLTEAGNFLRGNNSETLLGVIDSETSKYFIAGAFGIDEITDTGSIDYGIVIGLQNVYKLCRNDPETCLESEAAKDVARELKASKEVREEKATAEMIRERAEKKRNEVSDLQAEFNKRLIIVSLTNEEKARIVMLKLAMPVIFTRNEDYEMAAELFRAMIRTVAGAEARNPPANYAQQGSETGD